MCRFRHYLPIILILLVALFARAYNLATVPPGLDGDEMFNGWDASRALKEKPTVYFPANFGREPLHIYLMALTTRVLETTAWTLRLPMVLNGVVGIALTYALATRFFNRRVALLTSALIALSLWPLRVDRVALRAGLQPTFQVAAVYALWRALEKRNVHWTVAAGLLNGLVLYTYTAGRIFPLVVILWVGTRVLIERKLPWRHLLAVGAIALLTLAPLGLFAIRHPETFNNRINELNYDLQRMRQGNLTPLWDSITATAGMFTQAGDPKWRYNVADRPIFDPVTGLFFYLGLILSLIRVQRPAYLLMVIWLPIMLAPTIFSIGTPSFWRSVGAMTPIYLMPALGADFVWKKIHQWLKGDRAQQLSRTVLTVMAAGGLILVGADTWHDFFTIWPRNPEVLKTFEADLAAAARFLNTYRPDETPVWVSSDYPSDLSRTLLKYQTDYPGPVRWFDGRKATIWPAGWVGQDVLMIFTWSSPPNPDAEAVLDEYAIYEESDPAGRPHLWIYRIPGEALSETPWQPQQTVDGRFTQNREILGYNVPTQVERRSTADATIYWRVPTGVRYDSSDVPFSYVCLLDQSADWCMDRTSQYQMYPIWDWTPGDVVAQRYAVPVPAYVLPQTTAFRVGMFTSRGDIRFADGASGVGSLEVGPVEVRGGARMDPQWDGESPVFNEELALLSHHISSRGGLGATYAPGSRLTVELQWQAIAPPSADYTVRLSLHDQSTGKPVATLDELLGSTRHPTSRWAEREPAHTYHPMQIPATLESGEFELRLALLRLDRPDEAADSITLKNFTVSGRPHAFDRPTPQEALEARFGEAIRLVGYDLQASEGAPGGELELTLYWRALETISEDYKVFVHLYASTGDDVSGQHDSRPGNGALPTWSWLADEFITDTHTIPIESGAATGASALGVGFYDPTTGKRLPAFLGGEPQPNDVLIIDQIDIT